MRLPGEPAKAPLGQSLLILGAVLAETEVVERASSNGEGVGFALSGAAMGLISGVLMGGEDALEAEPLLDEAALLALSVLLVLREVTRASVRSSSVQTTGVTG
jgi:ABC-type cobalamin transport system permease subunit